MKNNQIIEKKIKMELTKNDLKPFILYLILGVLYSIKNKTISPDVGIWSLRRPIFFKPLKKIIPKEIIDVIEITDELSAIEELSKTDFENKIDILIEKLLLYLKQIDNPNFLITWLND